VAHLPAASPRASDAATLRHQARQPASGGTEAAAACVRSMRWPYGVRAGSRRSAAFLSGSQGARTAHPARGGRCGSRCQRPSNASGGTHAVCAAGSPCRVSHRQESTLAPYCADLFDAIRKCSAHRQGDKGGPVAAAAEADKAHGVTGSSPMKKPSTWQMSAARGSTSRRHRFRTRLSRSNRSFHNVPETRPATLARPRQTSTMVRRWLVRQGDVHRRQVLRPNEKLTRLPASFTCS